MVYLAIVISIIAIDFVIKRWVRNHGKDVLLGNKSIIGGEPDSKIMITHLENKGVVGGALRKNEKLVLLMTSALLATVASLLGQQYNLHKPKLSTMGIGLSLVLGGGLSNLFDRLRRGSVTDYIRFPRLPIKKIARLVFNFSDFCIFIGTTIYAICQLLKKS